MMIQMNQRIQTNQNKRLTTSKLLSVGIGILSLLFLLIISHKIVYSFIEKYYILQEL